MQQLESRWKDFHEIRYRDVLLQSVSRIEIVVKTGQQSDTARFSANPAPTRLIITGQKAV
jgi:hypothetical protein